jgi:protocatechuate 3,4-dioxygenase beta subunit
VLVHELAHVKRFDCLTQWIANLVCLLFWFNPLAWIAARRMLVERERACDDLVLMSGARASTYADDLLQLALVRGALPARLSLAMARRSQISSRLLAVLDPEQRRYALRPRAIAIAAIVLAAFLFPLAALSPAAGSGRVSGRVLLNGEPAAGITVRAQPFETPFQSAQREARDEPSPAAIATTTTRDDGSFALDFETEHGDVRLALSGEHVASVRLKRILSNSNRERVGDILLSRGQALAGVVRDSAGGPVVGAAVTLWADGPKMFEGPTTAEPEMTTTGPAGRFRFERAAEAGNRLRVELAGLASVERSGLRSGALRQPFVLRSGRSVAGSVRLPDGRAAAAGALVRFEGSTRSRWVEAGKDGSFLLEDLGHAAGSIVANAGVRGRGTVSIGEDGGDVIVILAKTAGFRGHVVDSLDSQAVPNVSVYARAGDDRYATRARADGSYELTALPAGAYSLEVDDPAYVPWSRDLLSVRAAAVSEMDIVLTRGASLQGRVVDQEGRPIAGASGELTRGGETALSGFLNGWQSPGLFRSDQEGWFEASRLKAGSQQSLKVRHDEYAPSTVAAIDLAAGETRSGLIVTLYPGLTLQGVVLDPDDQPVAGASVVLQESFTYRASGIGFSFGAVREAGESRETGVDGRFEIRGVVAGEYSLVATKERYRETRIDKLTVSEDTAAEGVELRLEPGVMASGFVRTASGQGAADLRVVAYPSGAGDAAPARRIWAEGASGSDGAFVLKGLERGASYDLVVDEFRLAGVVPPADDLVIVVDDPGGIRGVVVAAADGRVVTDYGVSAEPERPPGAMMFKDQPSTTPGRGEAHLPVHAADGAFFLEGVPAGRWTVEVVADGYAPSRIAGVNVKAGDVTEDVEVKLEAGRAVSGRIVAGDTKRPVAGARVVARSASEPAVFYYLLGETHEPHVTQSDTEGHFEIRELVGDSYRVKVEHPQWSEASKTVDLERADAQIEFRLDEGGTVIGTVILEGAPLAASIVTLKPTDVAGATQPTERTATSDEGGRFRFERLTPGRYSLTAALRQRTSAPAEAVIGASGTTESVTLTFDGGVHLRGVVLGLSAESLADTSVSVSHRQGFSATPPVAADGTFEVDGVPPGALGVDARVGMGARHLSKALVIAEAQTEVSVELRFEGTLTLEGHVSRAGEPVANVSVSARAKRPDRSGTARTDGSGYYIIEHLDPGTYEVSTQSSQGRANRTIELSSDGVVDLEVPTGRLIGTIVEEATGEPLSEVAVGAAHADQTASWTGGTTSSDAAGEFAIEGLESVDYRLVVRKAGYQTVTRIMTASNTPPRIRIELTHGEGIGIQARDGLHGTALSALQVRIIDPAGVTFFGGSLALDSEGRGDLPAVPPGAYTLRASAAHYAPAELAISSPAPTISLALTPGGVAEISLGPQTQGKPDDRGRILHADGRVYFFWIFSEDPVFDLSEPVHRVTDMPPGRYELVLESGSRYPFEITEGETTAVSLP